MSTQLEPSQLQRIEAYFEQFRDFLKTDKAREWDQERKDRIKLYERLLGRASVDKLTEVELGQMLQTEFSNQMSFLS